MSYINWVDANINNCCSRFYPIPSDQVRNSDSCDDYVRLSCYFLRVLSLWMHNADSCICFLIIIKSYKDGLIKPHKKVAPTIRNKEESVHTCNNSAAGIPTILLLPITTALFPFISTPYLCSNSIHPFGVQGTKNGSRPCIASRPMFRGWKPSTSFSILTAFKMFSSFICCTTEMSIGWWNPCTYWYYKHSECSLCNCNSCSI